MHLSKASANWFENIFLGKLNTTLITFFNQLSDFTQALLFLFQALFFFFFSIISTTAQFKDMFGAIITVYWAFFFKFLVSIKNNYSSAKI